VRAEPPAVAARRRSRRPGHGPDRPPPTPPQVAAAASPAEAAATRFASGDVYADVSAGPAPRLGSGVRKHVLSVFVADESGLINRVAGVFARRDANIESLAVGLTRDKALFTIVATGTDADVSNLAKQLAKLVNVQFVEDITDAQHVTRELVMATVRCAPGAARAEVSQLAEMFRARVLDVGEESLTLAVTGDPGKVAAFQAVLGRYGVAALARTGRIALKRGEALFAGSDAAQWAGADAAGRRPDAAAAPAPAAPAAAAAPPPAGGQAAANGVYSGGAGAGPWEVRNVLEQAPPVLGAAYNPEYRHYDPYTLSVEVADVPGVLNQVTGVISRRGYNVQSLAVGATERPGVSRITLVVPGDEASAEKLVKQINKLVNVERVTELHSVPHVARELMLIKVRATAAQRGELVDLAAIFHGAVCDVARSTLTIEVTGKETKMRALQEVLAPYGILEIARTGRVALARELGLDTRSLAGTAGARVML
jgi:acetolactate synthase-1/3 small subunit